MTIEHKFVAGLEDIQAVTFECSQCHTRVTMRPDDLRVPAQCPAQACGAMWVLGEPANYQSSVPLLNFVNAITQIRKRLKDGGVPFRILLEFDEPERK